MTKRPSTAFLPLGVRDLHLDQNANAIIQWLQWHGKKHGFERFEHSPYEEAAWLEQLGELAPRQPAPFEVTWGKHRLVPTQQIWPALFRSYNNEIANQNPELPEAIPLRKWLGVMNYWLPVDDGLSSSYRLSLELVGPRRPLIEAQTIAMAYDWLGSIGLKDIVIELNFVGSSKQQQEYQESVSELMKAQRYEWCQDCQAGHKEKNWQQYFRCNEEGCVAQREQWPPIFDQIPEKDRLGFTALLEALDEISLPYQINPMLFSDTGQTGSLVALRATLADGTLTPNLLVGGARDQQLSLAGLSEGLSFGLTGELSDILSALGESVVAHPQVRPHQVYLVPLGELATRKSFRLYRDLLSANIEVHDHFGTVNVKNQLRLAEQNGARVALIMGQKEAVDEEVILRDVKSGMQEVFSYDKIIAELCKHLDV